MPKPVRLVDQAAEGIAKAASGNLNTDGNHYRRLSLVALKPLMTPTEAMVDAACAAVSFDNLWRINSRADLRQAVRALVLAAEGSGIIAGWGGGCYKLREELQIS